MKVFVKNIERCEFCPNIGYIHFDGEGESCAYQYWHGVCQAVNKDLPGNLIMTEPDAIMGKDGYVPKRRIPNWCPLKDA